MTYVDPKAPTSHPAHPIQVAARARGEQAAAPATPEVADAVAGYLQRHQTPHEVEAAQVPTLTDLEHRQLLVQEWNADPTEETRPTIEDLTGAQYTWTSDADTTSTEFGWSEVQAEEAPPEPDPEPAKPARRRAKPATLKRGAKRTDKLDDALAALDRAKGK